jgi:glycosyltransferase involved in cell wall biosynthesis
MKNVLYITYDGLTDPLGQSQVLPYLKELSKKGYSFTILSFEKKTRYKKEAAIVKEMIRDSDINWVPLFFSSRPPVLSKIYDRWKMQTKAKQLHRKIKFDLLHCRSYVSAEIGLEMKHRYGVKWLFDMRGFWADEKVDNGQWDQSKLFYRRLYNFYKTKEQQFLESADGIVSLTQKAKTIMLERPGCERLDIDVIPCCADLAHFDYNRFTEKDSSLLKKHLGIPAEAKLITYLGSVGGWYMVKEMFHFYSALHKLDPKYVMLILTKDDPIKVSNIAKEAGVDPNLVFITYSNRLDLPLYLSMCNASVFFIRNSFSKSASSPTKHAELMGMGIPVICNDIGDTGNIIRQTGTGIVVNEFDDAILQQAAMQLPALEKIPRESIRSHAKKIFDLHEGAFLYEKLYNKILNANVPN